jgi:hypothetical protein
MILQLRRRLTSCGREERSERGNEKMLAVRFGLLLPEIFHNRGIVLFNALETNRQMIGDF